ncbi:MAG TPA: LON peptidase substrate-binding domain-containing protein, partial [Polyangiaceae bacterium]|nr:LON peptidase substrate-binding domain-containing protein [Polyangiaceae bacterium]
MTKLRGGAEAPLSPFPLLPLRTGILYPGTVITLPVGRERSIALLKSRSPGEIVGIATQRSSKVEDPTEADLHTIGTFARIMNIVRLPAGELRVTLQGLDRFNLRSLVQAEPFWLADGEVAPETSTDTDEARLLAHA